MGVVRLYFTEGAYQYHSSPKRIEHRVWLLLLLIVVIYPTRTISANSNRNSPCSPDTHGHQSRGQAFHQQCRSGKLYHERTPEGVQSEPRVMKIVAVCPDIGEECSNNGQSQETKIGHKLSRVFKYLRNIFYDEEVSRFSLKGPWSSEHNRRRAEMLRCFADGGPMRQREPERSDENNSPFY